MIMTNICVCAIIKNNEGKLLSVTRKDNFTDWGLPGGKVDDNDDNIVDTIVREVLEETGYHIKVLSIAPSFCMTDNTNGNKVITLRCVLLNNTPETINTEVETGLVDWKNASVLVNGTSFDDYNMKCFDFFNIQY